MKTKRSKTFDKPAQVITNAMQHSFDSGLRELTTPESLVTLAVAGKLNKKGIRLSVVEREWVRDAVVEFLRTENPAVLHDAIARKWDIRFKLTDLDLEKTQQRICRATQDAVQESIRKTSRTLARTTREWADTTAERVTSERAGFEKRLARTWSDSFRRYGRFCRLAQHVGELAVARFQESKLDGKTNLASALVRLHVRACSVAEEVATLMCAGYADGAAARWRTLHEIAVTAAFIADHGEDTAERYLAHFACEELKGARSYQEHCRALGYRSLSQAYVHKLEAHVNELRAKYGDVFRDEYGWAAHALNRDRVRFVDIESAVKRPFMRPFYRLASEQIHASSRGSFVRGGLMNQTSASPFLLIGPSNYGFADAGINSAQALLIATTSLAHVDPTIDICVMIMILENWLGPLMGSFVRSQRAIEKRENRLKSRRKKIGRAT